MAKEMTMPRLEAPRIPPERGRDRSGAHKRVVALFLLLLGLSLILAGCGGYASQADKYLAQGRSETLGSAYTLERFGHAEVSGPFLRASLEQYAKAMKSTARSIESLKPPPGAREEQQRQVEAISRARSLVQGAGDDPEKAHELARKLREIARELKA